MRLNEILREPRNKSNALKYVVVVFCMTTAVVLWKHGPSYSQEKALQQPRVSEPPEHIMEVIDAVRDGLVALDMHMQKNKYGIKYKPLASRKFRLDIAPDDDDGGWSMTVRIIPEKPSAWMWVTITESGEVKISDGL